MLFWDDRTATPLPTHNEHRTSKTLGSLPCFSNSDMITLICSSLIMLRASGESTDERKIIVLKAECEFNKIHTY